MARKTAAKKATQKSHAPKKRAAASVAAKPIVAQNGMRLRRLKKRDQNKREKERLRQQAQKSVWALWVDSLRQLYQNKRLFIGILLVYAFLYLLFVKGFSGSFQLGALRDSLNQAFNSKLSTLGTGFALYGLLLGTTGSGASAASGVYQTTLIVIISLSIIWALRMTYSGKNLPTLKDSFYKSMSQLVPFVLVGSVLILQLIPSLVVISLYSVVQANGLAVNALEQILAAAVLAGGIFLSLYWLSSSVFALYIVTLSNSQPRAALRAAKELVTNRRAFVIRRVVFLPIILLVFSAAVLVPLIIFLAPAAEILFMFFTILSIAVMHSYYYHLYRSLL